MLHIYIYFKVIFYIVKFVDIFKLNKLYFKCKACVMIIKLHTLPNSLLSLRNVLCNRIRSYLIWQGHRDLEDSRNPETECGSRIRP